MSADKLFSSVMASPTQSCMYIKSLLVVLLSFQLSQLTMHTEPIHQNVNPRLYMNLQQETPVVNSLDCRMHLIKLESDCTRPVVWNDLWETMFTPSVMREHLT